MSKGLKNLLTALVVFLIICLAFYPRLKATFGSKADQQMSKENKGGASKDGKAGAGGGKTVVSVVVVSNKALNDLIKSTGSILANEEIEIRSEISGKITNLYFKEGDFVKSGTLLIKLFDADLQAQLKKLQYSKKLAEENEFRQRKLLEKEAISQREYDVAVTSVNTLQADIDNISAQLTKTLLKAPFDGTIGLRSVSEGSYLSPATKIATLTNVNPAKLDFSVPAKYASIIKKGARVQFSIEEEKQLHYGTVYAIDPKIDPLTRTLQIRAIAPNANKTLIPGSFARVELILGTKGQAIQVPTEAIIPDIKGQKVFLVKNGKAQSQNIELGLRGDREVEVKKGLFVGDTLIVVGIQQVKPDGEVEIKEVVKQ
jgi:membrane fusion protein (multidrug efflux system)